MKASTCFNALLLVAIVIANVASKSVLEHTGSQIPAKLDGEFRTSHARKVVSVEGKDLDKNSVKRGGLIGKDYYHGGLLGGEERDKVDSNLMKRDGQSDVNLSKLDNVVGEEHSTIDLDSMKHDGLIGEEGDEIENFGERCISVQKCMKKKLICYRKCNDSSGKEVNKTNVPGSQCTVVCKKCVPNC